MTTSEIKCKCGSTKVYIDKVGTNIGLYCSECGKWIKWLNKDELRIVKKHIQEQSNLPDIKPDNELKFIGMNITEAVLDHVLKQKKIVTKNMHSKEIEAYERGISDTLACLQVLLCDSDYPIVNTYSKRKEYTFEELKDYMNKITYSKN